MPSIDVVILSTIAIYYFYARIFITDELKYNNYF